MSTDTRLEIEAELEACMSAYERGLEIEPLLEASDHEKRNDNPQN